jgi:hypothetical protein
MTEPDEILATVMAVLDDQAAAMKTKRRKR